MIKSSGTTLLRSPQRDSIDRGNAPESAIDDAPHRQNPTQIQLSAASAVKWCPQCEVNLPVSEFHLNAAMADGRATLCKSHQNAAHRKSYALNDLSSIHVAKAEARRNKIKGQLLQAVWIAMDQPCKDCGKRRNGKKMCLRMPLGFGAVSTRHSPTTMARLGYQLATILEWIRRGDVVCLQCRRLHPGETNNRIRANEIFGHQPVTRLPAAAGPEGNF